MADLGDLHAALQALAASGRTAKVSFYYVGAAEFVPVWGLVVLWLAWAGLLAFAIWLMRMSPGWVLAMPVLSVIVLALRTATLEFAVLLAG